MKSPSEIAREILNIWNPGHDPLTPSDNIMLFDRITKAITTERQRQERLIELVDGCTPVIESWAVISVAQAEWKKRWLSEAKQVLKENQ